MLDQAEREVVVIVTGPAGCKDLAMLETTVLVAIGQPRDAMAVENV